MLDNYELEYYIMARLPIPGGDNGNWGDILNEYLSQSLKSDGTIKDNAVTNSAIAADAITATEIANGTITEDQLTNGVRSKLDNSGDWTVLTNKPAIIAAGATTSAARAVIDAASNASVIAATDRSNHTGTQLANTISDFTQSVQTIVTSYETHKQRLNDLPDKTLVETVVSRTISTLANQSTTSTTIASGIVACALPAISGKISTVGCDADDLARINTYDVYGANWRANGSGTSGTATVYTSSFGIDFWIAGSRYVEFQTGTLDTNLFTYKIWVDGRPATDLPATTTWTNPSYNLIKIDLADSNPHRVRIMVAFGGIGKIWTAPGGTLWPSIHRGPRLLVLGDSFTGHTTMNTGSELGVWLPRFAAAIGADDYWNGAISGTGPLKTASPNYPNYQSRATTDVVPSNADLIIIGGWINDMSESISLIESAYANIFTTLHGMSSNPEIIAFGSPDPTGIGGSSWAQVDSAIQAVASDYGIAYVSFYTGDAYNKSGTKVYTGNPLINTANKSLFVGADNAHANDLGHKVVADHFYTAYRAILKN